MRRRTRGGLGVGSAAKLIVRLQRSRKRAQTRISDREQQECVICMNPLGPSSGTKTLVCRHTFHTGCIDQWIRTGHHECPLCRRPIPREPRARTRRRQPTRELVEEAARMDSATLLRSFLRHREGTRRRQIVQAEVSQRAEAGQEVTDVIDGLLTDEGNSEPEFINDDVDYDSTLRDFLRNLNPILQQEAALVVRENFERLTPLTDDQILDLQLYRDIIRLPPNLFSWDTLDKFLDSDSGSD